MKTSLRTRKAYRSHMVSGLVASFLFVGAGAASLAATDDKSRELDPAKVNQAVNHAVNFLQQAQANDGSFSAASGPGITAIVTTALVRNGRTAQDPLVARSLKYLEGHRHNDGGIYQNGS